MPYRVHLRHAEPTAADRLIELGALDIEALDDAGLMALMPDGVALDRIAGAAGAQDISIFPAIGRDGGSVWVLRPRPIRIGRLQIAPADAEAEPGALRLVDTPVFGSGLHPTTMLCLEVVEELTRTDPPDRVLDVGTGSGVLALAALKHGVARATAIDIDDDALRIAAGNARINGLGDRVDFARGGPETVEGTWPLVLANIAAAPLIEMTPLLVRRVGHHGRLVLSGIPQSVEPDLHRAYRRAGLHHVATRARGGWIALHFQASW